MSTSLSTSYDTSVPHPFTSIEVLPSSDPLDIAMFDAVPGFERSIPCEPRYFSNHYGGFVSLVTASYEAHVANNRTLSGKLPLPLFLYYCEMALWCKLLHVLKRNSHPLDALVADAIRLEQIGNFYLPPEVIEYIDDVGNFIAPDSVEYFLTAPFDFSLFSADIVKGLLGSFGPIGYNETRAWSLLETPLPFVVCRSIQECLRIDDSLAPPTMWTDPHVAPRNDTFRVIEIITSDVLGYFEAEAFDDATVSTLHNLGWSSDQVPSDMKGSYLCISPSTLNYLTNTLVNEMPHFQLCSCARMVNGRGRCSQTVLLQVSNSSVVGNLADTTYSTPKCYYNVDSDMWSRGAIFRFQLVYETTRSVDRFSGCGWYYKVVPPDKPEGRTDWVWTMVGDHENDFIRASTFDNVEGDVRHKIRCPNFSTGRFELTSTVHGALLKASLIRRTQKPP